MGVLDNFQPTIYSDNRPTDAPYTETHDTVVVGGTSTHWFILPFQYSLYAKHINILYSNGLDLVLDLDEDSPEIELTENGYRTAVRITLTPEDTRKFTNRLLSGSVQCLVTTKADKKIYGDIFSLKILEPLDKGGTIN